MSIITLSLPALVLFAATSMATTSPDVCAASIDASPAHVAPLFANATSTPLPQAQGRPRSLSGDIPQVKPNPEPVTLALLGLGGAGLAYTIKRRHRPNKGKA